MESRRLLTSWKEIAAFFERDVRTVQRWEKEEGLPVHRHLHQRQSSVYAYSDELEEWWSKGRVADALMNTQSGPRLSLSTVTVLMAAALILGGLVLWFGAGWRPAASDFSSPSPFPAKAIEISNLVSYRAGVGDVNGDGRLDLILASRDRVNLLLGENLWQGGQFPKAATTTIRVSNLSGTIAIGPTSDYNGDGLDDVLITNALADNESLLGSGDGYLLFGRVRWPPQLLLPDQADVVISLDYRPDARLTPCLHTDHNADIDGDGLADVLLGAAEFGWDEQRSAGGVFILPGRREWPSRVNLQPSDAVRTGSRMGEGLSIPCALGDLNNDRQWDLAVAASEATLWNLLGGQGRVAIFQGPIENPRKTTDQAWAILQGDVPDSILRHLVIDDINGDGRDDLVVPVGGEWELQAEGSINIWFGGRDGLPGRGSLQQAHTILRGRPGGMLGEQVLAKDFDGDEIADLVVSEGGSGRVYLIWGQCSWPETVFLEKTNPVVLLETSPGPVGIMASGDLDSDCLSEVIIPLSQLAASRSRTGQRVWVVKPYREMRIDIRPGVVPNLIGAEAGISAVRLYGFSVGQEDQIDPSTIRFGGARPIRTVVQDYDHDGFLDIQAYFDNSTVKIHSKARCAAVTARSLQGQPLGGSDSIEVGPHLTTASGQH